jgi:hypothetical protein
MRRQFAQSLLVVAIAAPILTAITVARAQDLRIHTVYIVDYQTGSVMLDRDGPSGDRARDHNAGG